MKFKSNKEKQEFILNNLKFCHYILNHCFKNVLNADNYNDYYQQAVLSLIQAINYYDKEKQASFATYAYKYIRLSLLRFSFENSLMKAKRAKEAKGKGYEMCPFSIISYNNPISNNINKDKNVYLEEIIEDTKNINDYEDVLTLICFDRFKIKYLTEKEKKILDLKLQGFSQDRIARILNITQSTVSRTLSKIKEKLIVSEIFN